MSPRRLVLVFASLFAVLLARADVAFTQPEWALQAVFPAEPTADEQRTPSPQGDEIAQRRIAEAGGERFMLVRFVYPVVPDPNSREDLYRKSIKELTNARSGIVHARDSWDLQDHLGQRMVLEQPREKTYRELRFILIGASLYFASAEWLGGAKPSPNAAKFLNSIATQATFMSARDVDARERWREVVFGNFKVRYDASRWFRDPQSNEPNVVSLLRVDEMAEAEISFSPDRNPALTMEETVIAETRKIAESVKVIKRGKRMRGSASVEDLRYTVRADNTNFENHGYFYSGAGGTIRVRGWATDKNYPQVEGDITELLDGLIVSRPRS